MSPRMVVSYGKGCSYSIHYWLSWFREEVIFWCSI